MDQYANVLRKSVQGVLGPKFSVLVLDVCDQEVTLLITAGNDRIVTSLPEKFDIVCFRGVKEELACYDLFHGKAYTVLLDERETRIWGVYAKREKG